MTATYGPHRWSAGYHDDGQNAAYRGATFVVRDLSGARFVDCDLSGVKIVDGFVAGVEISGFVHSLSVNGVDVADYVNAELDRRHPERVQLRELGGGDDVRALWSRVEVLWAEGTARAEALPETARHERVEGEWSFVETLRHLVFIVDSWASRTILDEEGPFHPLALPQTAYRPADAAALGMQLDLTPSYAEVLAVFAGRQALVRGLVEAVTDDELERVVARAPAPGYPEESRTVGECLGVVLSEELEHLWFAERDLATLESG